MSRPRINTVQLRLCGCSLWAMPGAGWRKPESDRRLSDLVSVGVLTRVFPAAVVDEVIEAEGRTQQRHRSLPARVMAYFAIAMGLYSEGSYEDVLGQLTDGLAGASGWREQYRLPGKSAIFQARERLGSGPLASLFARVACPLGGRRLRGRGWLGGGWSLWTGCVWMWPTLQLMMSTSVGRGLAAGVRRLPSRRRGFWGWPSAPHTWSSPRRSGVIVIRRLSWPGNSWVPSARACCCWLIGDSSRMCCGAGYLQLDRICCGGCALIPTRPSPCMYGTFPTGPGWPICKHAPTVAAPRCWPASSTTHSMMAVRTPPAIGYSPR